MGRTWLSFLIVLIGSSASNLRAQDRAADPTMLSLEEWMDVDVIPIDVLGAHIHLKGEWMIGYRTMYVRMGESRSTEADFMILATGMTMDMHMLDVTIGVWDDTPAGQDQKLPYPMQLGTGTFGVKSGLTYSNAHA